MPGHSSSWIQYVRRIALERNRSTMLQNWNIYLYDQRNIAEPGDGTRTAYNTTVSITPHNYSPFAVEEDVPWPAATVPTSDSGDFDYHGHNAIIPTSLEIHELNNTLSELQEIEERYMLNKFTACTDAKTAKFPSLLMRIKFQASGKRRLEAILKDLVMQNDNLEKRLGLNLVLNRISGLTGQSILSTITTGGIGAAVATTTSEDPAENLLNELELELGGQSVYSSHSPITPFPTGTGTNPSSKMTSVVEDSPDPLPQLQNLLQHTLQLSGSNSSHDLTIDSEVDGSSTSGRVMSIGYPRSLVSLALEDNCSLHTLDRICQNCRRVWRRASMEDR